MKEIYYLVRCYIKVYWFKLFGKADKSKVPKGVYCYAYKGDEFNLCPYWVYGSRDRMIAGCKLMGEVNNGLLLHDQCKECGVNDYEEVSCR